MNSEDFKNSCRKLCRKIINLENTECCICEDEIKTGTMIIPCNHYQFCFKCFSQLNECPLCRGEILHVVNYHKDCDKKSSHELINQILG